MRSREVVLMAFDVTDAQVEAGTECVETKLQGEGPWSLGPDAELIFTPGHTEVLFYLIKGGGTKKFLNIVRLMIND